MPRHSIELPLGAKTLSHDCPAFCSQEQQVPELTCQKVVRVHELCRPCVNFTKGLKFVQFLTSILHPILSHHMSCCPKIWSQESGMILPLIDWRTAPSTAHPRCSRAFLAAVDETFARRVLEMWSLLMRKSASHSRQFNWTASTTIDASTDQFYPMRAAPSSHVGRFFFV